MAKKDPSKDPSTRSAAWLAMKDSWEKVDTLLGGTAAMRAAGETYLPRHENESTQRYADRLEGNVLFNMTKVVLDGWTARPFSDPVKMEGVPAAVEEVLDDVDAQGNSVTTFARQWFREGLGKALCHVLVEFPSADGAPRTLADDRAQRRRPYWCLVKPENLIAAVSETHDGKEVLTHVRIAEAVLVRDGFAERLQRTITVYDRAPGPEIFVTVYEPRQTKGGEVWVPMGEPQRIDIDQIPLVTFYADRTGFMVGTPPVEEVADLNVRWWQSNSDQVSVLTVARFPMLAQSGGTDEGKVLIGPKQLLHIPDTQGRFYYVEHAGNAIEAGRKDLQDLEDKMASYGAEFLRKKPGDQTATARALDSAEATSRLQDASVRFNDSMANALALTAKWMKVEEPGKVSVAVDFGPEEVETADFAALAEARRMRDISREQYLAELKRRGTLADDFDAVEDERKLSAEEQFGAEASLEP